jgi:CII-binding regulator of phage lambda lysogenization HflD
VAIEQWNDEKLNKLAEIVNHLAGQLQQISNQVTQLGYRVEQMRSSVDHLVSVIETYSFPQQEVVSRTPNLQKQDWLDRLTQLEEQVNHLSNRIKYLERQDAAFKMPIQPTFVVDEDEIEDEPDEILWDFMEPSTQDKRSQT